MLNLILSVETNVEGYIYEVLHREYLNIVADFEIHSMDAIDTNPDYSWLLSNRIENIENSKSNVTLKIDTPSPVVEQQQNVETLSYDDIIDCLTATTSSHKNEQQNTIKASTIQNLSEIFNKTTNSSAVHLIENASQPQQQQFNLYTQQQQQQQQQPQMLNVLLVSGGVGFLSVVKNN